MGVKEKGFADWIVSTFSETVKNLGPTDISHFDVVCIDINPLLHTCLRNAKTEAKFVKLLFVDLDRCLRLTIPQSVVYLAVDGSPPLAKMKEQIRRRKSKAPSKNKHLDSSSITPGTAFMLRVTEYLHYYCARYLATKHHATNLQFIVDPAETPGEGEAKIMKFLCQNASRLQDRKVAIFSGDSDVIIQSLLNPVPNIYVLRNGVGQYIAVSVSKLRHAIQSDCGETTSTEQRVITDFAVLVMMSGNDYIRKLRGARMSKVWPVYKKFRLESRNDARWSERYLINEAERFDFGVLQELLVRIRRLTIRAAFKPDLAISLSMLGLSSDPPGLISDLTADIDSDEEYPDEVPIPREQKVDKYTRHIPNYLESLLWTLKMYRTGVCPDVTFIQVGFYLTIEQILTFIARDLPVSKDIAAPSNEHFSALVTFLCTVSLLDASKSILIPESWRLAFALTELRSLSRSMIHDTSLVNDTIRVQSLVYQMGQLIVSCIDPSSPIVQLLTYGQAPIMLSQSRKTPQWNATFRQLGTSHLELWSGVEVLVPCLPHDPSLSISSLSELILLRSPHNGQTKPEDAGMDWPFKTRRPKAAQEPLRKTLGRKK